MVKSKKKVAKAKTAKKSTAKPKQAKRVVKKVAAMQDFKLAAETTPFWSFKLTDQTFYWLTLLVLIFALGIWVLDIQVKTNEIINAIEASI